MAGHAYLQPQCQDRHSKKLDPTRFLSIKTAEYGSRILKNVLYIKYSTRSFAILMGGMAQMKQRTDSKIY